MLKVEECVFAGNKMWRQIQITNNTSKTLAAKTLNICFISIVGCFFFFYVERYLLWTNEKITMQTVYDAALLCVQLS